MEREVGLLGSNLGSKHVKELPAPTRVRGNIPKQRTALLAGGLWREESVSILGPGATDGSEAPAQASEKALV